LTHFRWQGIAAGVLGVVCLIVGIVTADLKLVGVGLGVVALVGVFLLLDARTGSR
jgi:hypothetical protein